MPGLRYLKPGLAAVLVFVGGKTLPFDVHKIPPILGLAGIPAILTVAFIASTLAARRDAAARRTGKEIPLSTPSE